MNSKKKLLAVALSGSNFTVEYQAILNRAIALGYTLPSAAQQVKQNAFIIQLKADGIWALLDVLYIFATDGSSDFATLNWKSPTQFQASKVNSPTFTANQGFTGNGATMYLDTNWIPGTNGVNYTQNNASLGGWINTNVANTGVSFGVTNGVTSSRVNPRNASDQIALFGPNDNTVTTIAGTVTSVGFLHLKRIAGSGAGARQTYKNGVQVSTTAVGSNTPPMRSIYILCNNGDGAPALFGTRQISMVFAGASLNGLEATFYNDWNTYFTGL